MANKPENGSQGFMIFMGSVDFLFTVLGQPGVFRSSSCSVASGHETPVGEKGQRKRPMCYHGGSI